MKPHPACFKSLVPAFLIASIIAFTSCKKDIPAVTKDEPPKFDKPVVLVAGYESNGVNDVAKCWINDQELALTDGTNNASANSVFVSDNNIYIAGNDAGAVYWKNNTAIKLPVKFSASKIYSSANSVFVAGNKVYIAGNDSSVAVYWKDGNEESLNTSGNFNSSANSIFVTGNDIYVAGSQSVNAVYWKNGGVVNLTNFIVLTIGGAKASSIFASGGNVYVVGSSSFAASPFPLLNYWQNTVAVRLNSINNTLGRANSVFVSGNDTYIAGMAISSDYNSTNAVYWKNGDQIILTGSAANSFATSIYVSGHDVYVAGYEYNDARVKQAVYWKNGVEIKLSDGTKNAVALSIFVGD
jgi:hypothetical protein